MKVTAKSIIGTIFLLTASAWSTPVSAKLNLIEMTQKTAESQIRGVIEPVLDKYCHDECKLMAVHVTVDIATPDEIAPGFDEISQSKETNLAPSAARIKILIDEKVGPVSRSKLTDLIQQYLDTFDYPVKIETQLAHFPQPIGSAAKVTELRQRISKQFKATVDDLFRQFCPQQCLLADYELQTETVNEEEAQYGSSNEFFQDGGIAVKVKEISATLLVDESLSQEEQTNILEMAKLKTNYFKNVSLKPKMMKFPRPSPLLDENGMVVGGAGAVGIGGKLKSASEKTSTDNKTQQNSTSSSNNNNSETNSASTQANNSSTSSNTSSNNTKESAVKQERFEKFEKIERVENGDAVQAELQKFKVYGLVFSCAIISLLIFLAMANFRPRSSGSGMSTVHRVIQSLASDPVSTSAPSTYSPSSRGDSNSSNEDRLALVSKRYEIERLRDELMSVFAEQPKVAKQVFSRILTEEGVETTAQYLEIFGESVVIDMLRDPSLQGDMSELMEYYAKNTIELSDDERLELLRKLHNRTVTGKLVVFGNRSSNQFDFLSEMDGMQILEMIRTESLTLKAIVLTQCDPQKRATVYAQLDEETRMKLLAELSRIDYLPRDYIFNVSNALKRKRRENPRLNTEALPGSEVLVSLLERTGPHMQRTVVKNLEVSNPDSARTVKGKLVSIDTLRYLRDGQLLEVVLSLKHDELLQFLKGAPDEIRKAIYSKSPKELVSELEEELVQITLMSREGYQAVERKVLNRMKLMANDGLINLVETNERMFSVSTGDTGFIQAPAPGESVTAAGVRKAA